jgi:hypothetical protein
MKVEDKGTAQKKERKERTGKRGINGDNPR